MSTLMRGFYGGAVERGSGELLDRIRKSYGGMARKTTEKALPR